MDRQMEKLKNQYNNQPIPDKLDQVVDKAISNRTRPPFMRHKRKYLAGTAAAFVLFVGMMNTSPAIARAVAEIPALGGIVDILTFTEYKVDEGNYEADIRVPAINNLGEPALEESLNQKYVEEGRKLYESFMAEMEAQKAFGEDGHLRTDSGYLIKTDTEQLLSIGRYTETTVGSSATTLKYDTLDKKNRILLTLPSLFKDDRYIERISDNIKQQMQEQMQQDESKVYWFAPSDGDSDSFTSIAQDQNFYINQDHQLVIAFNEYEVAPGYMGAVEFIIPTQLLEDLLTSREYIQ